MRKDQLTALRDFKAHTSEHEMTIIKDDGVHRHINFKKPGTSVYAYALTTWPGHLAFSGDMNCYVFARLTDMFEFFRTDAGDDDYINPGYWGGKLQASSRGGHMTFDADAFKTHLIRSLEDHHEYSINFAIGIAKQRLEDALSGNDFEPEMRAIAESFEFEDFRFSDLWDYSAQTHTFHFLWCCHAIADGIRQYDAARVEGAAGDRS